MSSTSIVVDLGFGDAGKGTLVDALARRCSTPPLVVRFNGGAQAGHNVHTADGRHHTFSQFGSATFVPGARTLLSQHMIVHPTGLMRENDRLVDIGVTDALQRLLVHERALVVTPYQQAANRLRERARGAARHGTCGLGIGETVSDSLDYPEFAVRVGHLRDRAELRRRMLATRDHKRRQLAPLLEKLTTQDRLDIDIATLEEAARLDDFVDGYAEVGAHLRVIDAGASDDSIRSAEHVIFEGAQGVLLDEWRGFHPHTTWSTCTTRNAQQLIERSCRGGPVRSIGVVRAYATRHGQGPFPSYNETLTKELRETHNVDIGWQGNFRCGWFDSLLTRYALQHCPDVTEIALTCMDRMHDAQHEWAICDGYIVPEQDRSLFVMKSRRASDVGVACDLGPSGDLAHQERLAEALGRVAQSNNFVDRYHYAAEVSLRLGLPVTCQSFGSKAEDKKWSE